MFYISLMYEYLIGYWGILIINKKVHLNRVIHRKKGLELHVGIFFVVNLAFQRTTISTLLGGFSVHGKMFHLHYTNWLLNRLQQVY